VYHSLLREMYRKNSPRLRFSMYSSLSVDSEKFGGRCHSAARGGNFCVAVPLGAKVEPCCGLRPGCYRNYIRSRRPS
jgi:hypothetical protein